MNNIETAIKMVSEGTDSYVKFLSVNDTGKNNTHQSGVLISKTVKDMLFKGPLPSDRITDRWASIHWLNVGISTNSRFIYYASKNELRITNFSHGFPLLNPEEAGSLFILTKNNEQDYSAFIIDNGDEINDFLTYFGITPDNTNNYLPKLGYKPVKELIQSFVTDYFQKMHVFPTSIELSQFGRNLSYQIYGDTIDPIKNPDHALLIWSNSEFELFSGFEAKDIELRGGLQQIFAGDLDAYKINSIMNRRKSRAGKSLENQLEYLFKANNLPFTAQGITEEKKRPDFIFPSIDAYHNPSFPENSLISLAAKTTCKDRWRQIITEADRTKVKYLCTLQKGLSSFQMEEMQTDNVVLVVPKTNFQNFPSEKRNSLLSIKDFIIKVKNTCGGYTR